MVINVQLFYIGRLTSSCFQNKNWKFEIYGKGWYWERLKEIVVIEIKLEKGNKKLVVKGGVIYNKKHPEWKYDFGKNK